MSSSSGPGNGAEGGGVSAPAGRALSGQTAKGRATVPGDPRSKVRARWVWLMRADGSRRSGSISFAVRANLVVAVEPEGMVGGRWPTRGEVSAVARELILAESLELRRAPCSGVSAAAGSDAFGKRTRIEGGVLAQSGLGSALH